MRPLDRERAGDLAARLFVGVLFILLSINLLGDFTRTHRLTGLLLLDERIARGRADHRPAPCPDRGSIGGSQADDGAVDRRDRPCCVPQRTGRSCRTGRRPWSRRQVCAS